MCVGGCIEVRGLLLRVKCERGLLIWYPVSYYRWCPIRVVSWCPIKVVSWCPMNMVPVSYYRWCPIRVVSWCLIKVYRIQNILGSDVNMDSPEKNPTYSTRVKARERLSATSNLEGEERGGKVYMLPWRLRVARQQVYYS